MNMKINPLLVRIQDNKKRWPRVWSQQTQKDDSLVGYVTTQTSWMHHNPRFSERVYYIENGLIDYRKCKCGRDITNLKAKTCKQKDCSAFKDLLNKNRDKEKHRQSVKKTYDDGSRSSMSGADRAKISYDNQQELLDSIKEIYTLSNTIETLKPVYKNYFGRAGNRTLIKDNPKLYKSVKYHTEELRRRSNTQLRFTGELIFLCEHEGDINNIKCSIDGCNNIISYQATEKCFKHKVCADCYEPEIGYISKISQELFDNVACFVSSDCLYGNSSGEVLIRLTDIEKRYMRMKGYQYNKFFLDFVCGNKIIEYDGEYWHGTTKEYDKLRDYILTKRGYDVLRVSSNEYNNTKKGITRKQKTIEKCVEFLNE